MSQRIAFAVKRLQGRGETRDLVLSSWMQGSITQQFICNVPSISDAATAYNGYLQHLIDNPCFETLCRQCRPSGSAGEWKASDNAGWYQDYLRSPWWVNVSRMERSQFGSCVACDKSDDLHVHHRHYESVGRENIYTDLTLLCGSCHSLVHRSNPSLHPPETPPSWLGDVLATMPETVQP